MPEAGRCRSNPTLCCPGSVGPVPAWCRAPAHPKDVMLLVEKCAWGAMCPVPLRRPKASGSAPRCASAPLRGAVRCWTLQFPSFMKGFNPAILPARSPHPAAMSSAPVPLGTQQLLCCVPPCSAPSLPLLAGLLSPFLLLDKLQMLEGAAGAAGGVSRDRGCQGQPGTEVTRKGSNGNKTSLCSHEKPACELAPGAQFLS